MEANHSVQPGFLTTEEVASILKRSPRTVANWRHSFPEKSPPYIRLHGRVLYPESKFYAWLDAEVEEVA